MKQLTWRVILPLTIISFVTITKWWYVFPVDAPDTMMYGFPLAYMAEGWHTSMSIQFFAMEFILDFATYFLFWWLLLFITNKIRTITIPKFISNALLVLMGLVIIGMGLLVSMPEHVFALKRDFDVDIKASGAWFLWQNQERPNPRDYVMDEND